MLDVRRASRPSTPASASSRAASSEITEDTIGVIQFEFADWRTRAAGARDHGRASATKTADIPGILVEVTAPRAGPPTGKPIQVQLGALDPDAAAGGGQEGRRDPGGTRRHPRSRRRPAAARHRLEDRGRQGGGREIRRRRQHRRHRACSSSPTASRRPNTGRSTATSRSTSWCASRPTGAASTRSTICACRRPSGHVPIGNFVERVPAPRVGYINRVNGNRVMTVSANVAEGVQTAKVQQEIAARACQGRSRPGRHLQAQGRGRGARQGRRLPDEGVRHRDLPDLRDPAGAVQQADLGRRWC